MSSLSENVTTFTSTVLGTDAFRSIATELMIFCATIAVALVLKVTAFNSSCSWNFLHFWPMRNAQASKRQSCSQSLGQGHTSIDETSRPCAEPPRTMQAGGGRKPGPRIAATGPARVIETIMDRAYNKNATEALSLYQELCSGDRDLQLLSLLRSTRFSGLDFFSALLQSAVRAGHPELVERLLDDMARAKIERTLSFYESAMKVLAGKKNYREALAVYQRLHSEGFKASPVTLSCLINFAAELGDLDSAIGFFEQLASTSTPSIRAYMMALRVYSKRQDWSKSLEIFRSMQERGVQIDSLILNAVLATGVAAGKTEATDSLLQEVAKTNAHIVDTISYNTVLKGYAHQKTAHKALTLLDAMLERGIKANGITFNTVMDAAIRGGQADDAWKVLDRMEKMNIRPDKYTCTIMMKGLHEGSSPKQLCTVIDMIQASLPQCDSALGCSLFRGILQVAARLNNTSLLMRAFTMMQAHNMMPTTVDYQLMIQTFAQQSDTEHCSTIWRHAFKSTSSSRAVQQQPLATVAVAIFTPVMEELAKKDTVRGMICAFESLRAVVGIAENDKGSQKSHEHLLQKCRAALMQAASRKQHSSPALRRFVELADKEGLQLETFS